MKVPHQTESIDPLYLISVHIVLLIHYFSVILTQTLLLLQILHPLVILVQLRLQNELFSKQQFALTISSDYFIGMYTGLGDLKIDSIYVIECNMFLNTNLI